MLSILIIVVIVTTFASTWMGSQGKEWLFWMNMLVAVRNVDYMVINTVLWLDGQPEFALYYILNVWAITMGVRGMMRAKKKKEHTS